MRNDAKSIHVPLPSAQLVRLQSGADRQGAADLLGFDEDAVAAWRNADPPKGPGAPKVYSDTAIKCALVLKSVFHLSLRGTQGFCFFAPGVAQTRFTGTGLQHSQ